MKVEPKSADDTVSPGHRLEDQPPRPLPPSLLQECPFRRFPMGLLKVEMLRRESQELKKMGRGLKRLSKQATGVRQKQPGAPQAPAEGPTCLLEEQGTADRLSTGCVWITPG